MKKVRKLCQECVDLIEKGIDSRPEGVRIVIVPIDDCENLSELIEEFGDE